MKMRIVLVCLTLCICAHALRVSEDPASCGPASHPSPSEAAERAAHLLWNTQLYILHHQDQLIGNTHRSLSSANLVVTHTFFKLNIL